MYLLIEYSWYDCIRVYERDRFSLIPIIWRTCPVERTHAQINYGELLRRLSFLHASVNLPKVYITHIVGYFFPLEAENSSAQLPNKWKQLYHWHSFYPSKSGCAIAGCPR